MLNLEKMFVLIAARPQIRTVEIADIIDCDPDQVQPALQGHIDSGNLTVTEVTAPNGQPANAFCVTTKFMDGALWDVLLPSIEAQCVADKEAGEPIKASPRPVLPKAAPVQSTAAPVKAGPLSKVESAIQFVRDNGGRVSHTRMKSHMGLGTRRSPATWLAGAVRDGRLVHEGQEWILGHGVPPPPRRAEKAPAVVDAAPAPLRIAAWDDGIIEICRGARTVLTITRDEWARLQAAGRVVAEVAQ